MLNHELIRALVDDRERAIADRARRNILIEDGRVRWVRPPRKRPERR